jgi:hypothetical protein
MTRSRPPSPQAAAHEAQKTEADAEAYNAAFHASVLQKLVAAACSSFLNQAPDKPLAGETIATLLMSVALDCIRECAPSLSCADVQFVNAFCAVMGLTVTGQEVMGPPIDGSRDPGASASDFPSSFPFPSSRHRTH